MSRKILSKQNLTIFVVILIVILAVLLLSGEFNKKPPFIGGCSGTLYGCCPDNVTACDNSCSNC